MTRLECFAVLDIPLDSPMADVKLAYRQLALVWHPDRFSDEALCKKAHENLALVNAAYAAIRDNSFTTDAPTKASMPTMDDLRRKHAEELAQLESRLAFIRELAQVEEQRVGLAKDRAAVWESFVATVWKPCAIAVISIGVCVFLSSTAYVHVTHHNNAMVKRRAEMSRLMAESTESESLAMSAKARSAAAANEIEAATLASIQNQAIQLKLSESLERERLKYTATERQRIEAELQLLETIKGSPLVMYQEAKTLSRQALERENSKAGLFTKRCQRRIEVLRTLHDAFNSARETIQKSKGTEYEKLAQLSRLEDLYSERRMAVCLLQTLEQVEEYAKILQAWTPTE